MTRFRRLIPTPAEYGGLFFLTLVVLFIGNTQPILNYYGLGASAQLLQNSAGSAVTTGLAKLDSFSLTSQVVTFCIWGLTGLICFSLFKTLSRAYGTFRQKENLASNSFMHPVGFNRRHFWEQELLSFLFLIICLLLLAAGIYCFLAYALPLSLAYSRRYWLDASPAHVWPLALGTLITYVWLGVLVVGLKLLMNHRRLVQSL